jgi:hypothetical protein
MKKQPVDMVVLLWFFLSIIRGGLQGIFDRQRSDKILLTKTQLVVNKKL